MPDISKFSPDQYLTAFREDPTDAPLALYAGASLDAAGRHEEALCVWTLGDDANSALRMVHRMKEANEELRAHSLRADRAIAEHFTGLHRQTVQNVADEMGADLSRVQEGIWPHYATEAFKYQQAMQRPETFYMPGLPARPVTDNRLLPWAATVEAAASDIRDEYLAAISGGAEQQPYVPLETQHPKWDKLRGALDWAAVYLHYNAAETSEAVRFPKTIAALKDADLVSRDGVPLETFFSCLKPGAVIPPHHGLTNTRLTVHLPLIIPDGCSIRVGDKIYLWTEGELIAFDDSFEHEAANRSNEHRVVLIFETHHPDLAAEERLAIERVYDRFDRWVKGRRAVIGLPEEDTVAS